MLKCAQPGAKRSEAEAKPKRSETEAKRSRSETEAKRSRSETEAKPKHVKNLYLSIGVKQYKDDILYNIVQ
jgi:hypothetical protein